VYQELDELLEADAALLVLDITSKEEQLQALIAKSGEEKHLEKVLKWIADETTATHIKKANELTKQVEAYMNKALQKKKLDIDEAQLVKNALQQKLCLTTGKRNESSAIQVRNISSIIFRLFFFFF